MYLPTRYRLKMKLRMIDIELSNISSIFNYIDFSYTEIKLLQKILTKSFKKDFSYKTYFAISLDNKIIKIGRSSNPEKRVKRLKEYCKYYLNKKKEFRLIGYINYNIESLLHRFLKRFSIKGEFYRNNLFINSFIVNILKDEREAEKE